MTIKDVGQELYQDVYNLLADELNLNPSVGGTVTASGLFRDYRNRMLRSIKNRDSEILNLQLIQYALLEVIKTLNVEKIQALTNGN